MDGEWWLVAWHMASSHPNNIELKYRNSRGVVVVSTEREWGRGKVKCIFLNKLLCSVVFCLLIFDVFKRLLGLRSTDRTVIWPKNGKHNLIIFFCWAKIIFN
jgi:hypothetical protein